MKKMLSILLIAMICCLCGCQKNPSVEEPAEDARSVEQELHLENILLENGGYGWAPVAYGSSIEEAEKALDINFPEIPEYCTEWLDGTLPYHPENVKDYRNSTDYDFVCYAAYIGEEPLIMKYGEHRGHMLLDFYPDGLYAIYFRFGENGTVRDPLMNYGGEPNDVEAAYNQLLQDITRIVGEPTKVLENQLYESTTYSWIAEMEDGSKNRIQLDIDLREEGKGITQLSIYRIKVQ